MAENKATKCNITDDLVMLVKNGDVVLEQVFLMYNTKNVNELFISTKNKASEVAFYTGTSSKDYNTQGFGLENADCLHDSDNTKPTIIEFEGKFDTLVAQPTRYGFKVVLIRKTRKHSNFVVDLRENRK